jgi:CheY-like chemotaxis protein
VIIIAQTAYVLEGDREKAIRAGCNEYISKPFNQKALNKMIENLFN